MHIPTVLLASWKRGGMTPMTGVLEWKDTGSSACIRKDRQGRQGGSVALGVNDHLECMELCLEMDEELTESLWVRIKGRTGTGDFIVGVCYRPPDQKD